MFTLIEEGGVLRNVPTEFIESDKAATRGVQVIGPALKDAQGQLEAAAWLDLVNGSPVVNEERKAAALAAAALEKEKQAARKLLNETDWYIVREMDAGIPCPPEIKQQRQEARSKI